MKFRSVFDIIGPIMLGPSSSHTAGAARIGQISRKLFGHEPEQITIHFYGSFAQTYRGHATDLAVVGGILGMDVADPNLSSAIQIAKDKGIALEFIVEEEKGPHPNTVAIDLESSNDRLQIKGISIGGGAVQIVEYAGFPISLSGEFPTLLILNHDTFGAISQVTHCLEREQINIGHMEVSRQNKGEVALMLIETDEMIDSETLQRISEQNLVIKASMLDVDEI